MRAFLRAPGVLLEPLGESWAAFSTLSGETHIVNDESVAVIESLDEQLAQPVPAICARLATEFGVPATEIAQTVSGCWEQLIEAGLVREQAGGAQPPQ